VDRLRFITRGRELGFSLEEIRSLLALADDPALSCRDVDQLARHHLADIQQRVRELRRIARELERTIANCAGGKRGQCAILGALCQRPAPRDIHDAKQGAARSTLTVFLISEPREKSMSLFVTNHQCGV
jgi:MerR family mercuric resistance operon transcriptional regulator